MCCCYKKNKQVYAVEFTDMANHARRLVAKNGMEDVVEVIQCSVEDLKLDAKVSVFLGLSGRNMGQDTKKQDPIHRRAYLSARNQCIYHTLIGRAMCRKVLSVFFASRCSFHTQRQMVISVNG